MSLVVYTDGACKGNPGPGGFGAHFNYDGQNYQIFGGEKETTNNQMELKAVIVSLEFIRKELGYSQSVSVYSDSNYVLKGLKEWLPGWKRNNWKTASKQPVKNKELWERLDQVVSSFSELNTFWVKGHANDPGNEKADELANKGVFSAATKNSYHVEKRDVSERKAAFKP